MKKLIALLLALTMVVCFAACGGEEGGTNAPDNGGSNVSDNNETNKPAEVSGETYDAGNVSALIPDGWKAFPVSDMWSEEENATDPDQLNIVKGGETEFDLLTKPYIQIVHYEPGSMITPSKEYYENAADVESITAGGLTWEGFSGEGLLGDTLIVMWTTNADGHQFQLNIFNKTDAAEFALTDADVLAILGSIVNS